MDKEDVQFLIEDIVSNDLEKYLKCKKCGLEFDILYFEELPEEIQFRLILKKITPRIKAFFFYCKNCDEFSVLRAFKSNQSKRD